MRTRFSCIRLEHFVLILVLTSWPTLAAAQTREAAIGNPAPVTPLAAAATDAARRLAAEQTATVERRRNDSVLNGALIGAAAGVAGGLLLCRATEPWEVCNDPGPLARFAALGAGIGIGIDALIRKREVVAAPFGSTQVSVAPMGARGAKGLRVAVRF